MPIPPKPFIVKCPNCDWSKKIKPKSDVVDTSWGLEYAKCPKCGSKTERIEEADSFIDKIKGKFFSKSW